MSTLLGLAIRNLLQHKRRSALLATAVALVTVLLVLLSSLFNGMQATMLRNSTTLMTGHVNVAGFYKLTSGSAAPIVTKYEGLLELVKKATPGLKSVVTRGRGWGKIVSDTASLQSGLVGIDVKTETGFQEVVQVVHGKVQDLQEPHTCLIFEKQAERLGVKVGDRLTATAPTFRGANNTVDLRIVAVAKDLGFLSAFNVYMHHDSVRELYELDSSATGAIMVYLQDPKKSEEVAVALRKAIVAGGYPVMDRVPTAFWRKFETVRREDWVGQKIDITTWIDEMEFIRYTLQTLDTLIVVLVAILLVIIIVGVMNALWIAIRERTKEIGTLRAIGMQRGSILGMFMTEVAVLAVSATLTGALVGGLLCAGLNAADIVVPKAFQVFLMSETMVLLVDVPTAVKSLVVIAVVTTLGALFPAWQATKLQPVTAMHSST